MPLNSFFPFIALLRTSSITQINDVVACDDVSFKTFMDCVVAKQTRNLAKANVTCGGVTLKERISIPIIH